MDESFVSSSKSVKHEFDNKIGRLTKSKAYLDFCQEVYGYRMYLFNMMDKQQLDFVINSIPLSPDDTLLDLGCGSGSILKLLAEKYGCSGIGIDQLNSDAIEKSSKSVTYINGDIDRLPDYNLKPTVTLSIDSLYFSNDFNTLLRHLRRLKNNRMYLFYSQYLFEDTGARSILRADYTKLADILKQNAFSYETIDYSENERLLYERALAALEKRKEEFRKEGNFDLYEGKHKEDIYGKYLYDNGLASRFLYIVK